MARIPTHPPTDDTRATTAQDEAAHTPAPRDQDAPAPKGIAVGETIDGWTVQAIHNPTDVVIALGGERRSLTLQDLERAKRAAAPTP